MGCVRGEAAIADAIGIDADVESMVDAAAHQPLRQALVTFGDEAGRGVVTTDGKVESVRQLLREAYEASPEWAELFARWRHAHGRRYLQPTGGASDEAHALLAEARGFAFFRENVLGAHRAGRSPSLDARSDKSPDARRTLGHFG